MELFEEDLTRARAKFLEAIEKLRKSGSEIFCVNGMRSVEDITAEIVQLANTCKLSLSDIRG